MALLEGFENLSGAPLLPTDLSWASGLGVVVASGSGSNVTQGAQSYLWQYTGSSTNSYIEATGVDLTGANLISVDLTGSGGDNFIATLRITKNKDTATDNTGLVSSFSGTLVADISAFSDKTNCTIRLFIDYNTSTYNHYWDHLRDDTVGAPGKIKLGNVEINKIYLGTTLIKKAYLGTQVIYSKP